MYSKSSPSELSVLVNSVFTLLNKDVFSGEARIPRTGDWGLWLRLVQNRQFDYRRNGERHCLL